MFYYMHNNTNYQCKICWNKALTFGVGSIQLSFRIYHCVHPIHANMFSIQMLLHFSQIVPRVCTLVLSLVYILMIIITIGFLFYINISILSWKYQLKIFNNNNTQIAAIALPPSTTHPQLWAELLTFKPKCDRI